MIELATTMSSTGAVEYYEWHPADRLSGVLGDALVEEVVAWCAQVLSLLALLVPQFTGFTGTTRS